MSAPTAPDLSLDARVGPAAAAGVRTILDDRRWCVLEVCVDVPEQRWEPRLLICSDDPEAVASVTAEWVRTSPDSDVRLAAYARDTLHRVDDAPAPLCHLAEVG